MPSRRLTFDERTRSQMGQKLHFNSFKQPWESNARQLKWFILLSQSEKTEHLGRATLPLPADSKRSHGLGDGCDQPHRSCKSRTRYFAAQPSSVSMSSNSFAASLRSSVLLKQHAAVMVRPTVTSFEFDIECLTEV